MFLVAALDHAHEITDRIDLIGDDVREPEAPNLIFDRDDDLETISCPRAGRTTCWMRRFFSIAQEIMKSPTHAINRSSLVPNRIFGDLTMLGWSCEA